MSELSGMVDRLERGVGGLVDSGEAQAWSKICKAADRLVLKDGETDEQRIDRYLKTDAGKQAYAEYVAAKGQAHATIQKADQATSHSEIERWASERITERVRKAEAAGFEPEGRRPLGA